MELSKFDDLRIENFIDGRWSPPASGKYLDVWEPATGKVYTKAPDSGKEDVDRAVEAARLALPRWSQTPAAERAKVLRRISDAIERDRAKLAHAESVDTGKPLQLALSLDIPRAAQNFSFFADAITQVANESHAMDGIAFNYTLHDPVGVAACISPWNLPLYLLSWKIAPALAAGCCVVAKPSEITPMTAHHLTKLCDEVGLPAGVLNIVHGTGAGAGGPLVLHPRTRAISFTGSTRTGAEIARETAASFKKLSLEMGGKNAAVVFADCDFEETVCGVLRSAFANQGQVCLCGSRILVQDVIYEKFKKALVEKARALRLGDPLLPETEQGAVVSKPHFEKVLEHLAIARKEGGKVLTGGQAAKVTGRCASGWFIEPTLIEGLAPECRTNQEEIFGPVATLIPFSTDEEAIAIANGTRYGLSASVWTNNLPRAHRVASRLEAGVIWVNCWLLRDLRTPFGGVKDSGVGREGGVEALRFFTETRNVCVKIGGVQ